MSKGIAMSVRLGGGGMIYRSADWQRRLAGLGCSEYESQTPLLLVHMSCSLGKFCGHDVKLEFGSIQLAGRQLRPGSRHVGNCPRLRI